MVVRTVLSYLSYTIVHSKEYVNKYACFLCFLYGWFVLFCFSGVYQCRAVSLIDRLFDLPIFLLFLSSTNNYLSEVSRVESSRVESSRDHETRRELNKQMNEMKDTVYARHDTSFDTTRHDQSLLLDDTVPFFLFELIWILIWFQTRTNELTNERTESDQVLCCVFSL